MHKIITNKEGIKILTYNDHSFLLCVPNAGMAKWEQDSSSHKQTKWSIRSTFVETLYLLFQTSNKCKSQMLLSKLRGCFAKEHQQAEGKFSRRYYVAIITSKNKTRVPNKVDYIPQSN